MMQGKKNGIGLLLLAALMAITGAVLFRGQSPSLLWDILRHLKPLFLLAGLALMFCYVGCEAMCTHLILGKLGHRVPYCRCLGYSFAGFYASSITPSATGGQPAQIYYMSRDRIPAAHGALNMMLVALCYQTAALIWGGGILLLPSGCRMPGNGTNLLLLYGMGMMLVLTLGMGMVMFLPHPSRLICECVFGVLAFLRLLHSPRSAREKLERQLGEYAKGAACIKQNPGLMARVLLLCLAQLGFLFSVPWAVYLAFGLSGHSWMQVAGTQALLTLAVCNLPLPGAVGPAEGGFVAAFAEIFGGRLVKPAMLVSRGISFYAFLVISFLVSVLVHLRTAREARERGLQEIAACRTGIRVRAVRRYLCTPHSGQE